MTKDITECDLSALLRFTAEVDKKNSNAFEALETELESARKQYNKVVEQNKSLQSELKLAKLKLSLIQDLMAQQKVLEPTALFLKANIGYIMELSL